MFDKFRYEKSNTAPNEFREKSHGYGECEQRDILQNTVVGAPLVQMDSNKVKCTEDANIEIAKSTNGRPIEPRRK